MFLKKRGKKIFGMLLVSGVLLTPSVYADDSNTNYEKEGNITEVNQNVDSSTYAVSSEGWLPWKITSKSANGNSYGQWKFGTEGRGGSGVKIKLSKSYGVSHTLTGSIKVSKSTIDGSLGYTTGSNFSSTASYSVNAPDKKKIYTINVRNVYAQTKVSQKRDYHVNGKVTNSQYATAYGNKFTGFGYDWKTRNA